MAVTVTLCGVQYSIPQQGDAAAWGTALTSYLQALAVQSYFVSQTANPAASGVFRLARADSVSWRNASNSADLALGVGSSNQLQFGGVDVTGNPQAIYTTAAGQSIASSGTPSIVNFGTQEVDAASAVATGAAWKFTVPTGKGGLYVVSSGVTWNAAITTGTMFLQVFKNGSVVRTIAKVVTGTNTPQQMLHGATTLSLAAGDFIDVRVAQASGGAVVLTSAALENWVSIHRVVS